MSSKALQPHTEEVRLILEENEARLKRIFGTHDQYTGRGMDAHVHKAVIEDYPIRTQWLTDEVFNNTLYQEVMAAGSVKAYTEQFNEENGTDITKEDVIDCLFSARVARDPSFAFYTIYKIKSKTEGRMVPFLLNYPQRFVLAELEAMRIAGVPIRIILLKARQWGGSTLVQLYMSWIQLFVKEGWYSVIIAQTKDTAKRIKAMYKKVLDEMPAFIFNTEKLQFTPYEHSASDSIITNQSGEIVRDNVLTIASYENFESTRGMDYAMAHFSEVAYWKTTDGKSAEQVITNIDSNILELPLTMEVSESTANGMSGYFYDEYQLAKEGKSSRKAIFVPFYYLENDMIHLSPYKRRELAEWLIANKNVKEAPSETAESGEYLYSLWRKGATLEHINWYIRKRKSFHDHASMASEAPSDDIECFKFSGNRVFNIYLVEVRSEQYGQVQAFRGDISQSEKSGKIVLVKDDTNGNLRIWKHPDTITKVANRYLVVVDVGGRSQSSDPSCITVIDRYPLMFKGGKLEVVARWHGHLRYDFLAYKAVKIARLYNNALLAFESNTYDKKKVEASEFVEKGDHIRGILKKVEDDYSNLYMRAATDPEDIRNGILKKIGFQTNVKTKQDMVDNFIVLFEDDQFIDPDERAYKEMAIYEQRSDGSYGNIQGKGNHDDILMTDMIGALISNEMPQPSIIRPASEERISDNYPLNESAV